MRFATLILITAAAGPAAAADAWTWNRKDLEAISALEAKVARDGEFFKVETPAWTVRTAVSARFTAETARFITLFTDTFNVLVPGKSAVPIKPTLTILADEAEYRRRFTQPRLIGTRGASPYKWAENGTWIELGCYTFVKEDRERKFGAFYHPILLHEGTHTLLRARFGKTQLPIWFDEGLANFFQFWDLRQNVALNLGSRLSRSRFHAAVREALRGKPDSVPTLPKLLALGAEDWNPDQMGPVATVHYGAAETFVDFLFSHDTGRAAFKQYYDALLAGGPTPQFDARRLEPLWHRHILDGGR